MGADETMVQLKRDAVMDAYQGLSDDDRVEVDFLAAKLDSKMDDRCKHMVFSHVMAVELLGKIGMLMQRNGHERSER